MVKHSNALRRRTKHTHLLPYPDFPLSPHVATRRWYKVIRGRRVYFGPLDDPDAVLERYQRQRFRPCQHPHLTESHFAFRIVVGIASSGDSPVSMAASRAMASWTTGEIFSSGPMMVPSKSKEAPRTTKPLLLGFPVT